MSEDVDAAVRSYLEKPSPGPIALGGDYAIDVAAALESHKPSAERLARAEAAERFGAVHDAVRTAILLARPGKA